MFKVLITVGSMLFFILAWIVFELSIVEIIFFVLIEIFYFSAGYYKGIKESSGSIITKEEINNLLKGNFK